jgi:hypothetical protein
MFTNVYVPSYMCPHTTICVLILLHVSAYYYMCPHTIYVSSWYCVVSSWYSVVSTKILVSVLHLLSHAQIDMLVYLYSRHNRQVLPIITFSLLLLLVLPLRY